MFNRKQSDKKYRESFKGRMVHARAQKKYELSAKGLATQSKYDKTLKGKVVKRKKEAKRRLLGFFPLNKYFEGSEVHHVSQNFIIYIPENIHQKNHHSIWTWRGMDIINKLAFEFL